MKIITEEQAQELANLINCFIAVDEDSAVCAFVEMPRKDLEAMKWIPSDFDCYELPIRIKCDKPWYQQILYPQGANNPHF